MNTLEQLKAKAYDLIHLIETAKKDLAQINEMILQQELAKQKEAKDGE